MPKELRFPINTKVTIIKQGHRHQGVRGVVRDVVHKGQMVHSVRKPAPDSTYIGDFIYEDLKK